MKTDSSDRFSKIDRLYRSYSQRILGFIASRINDRDDAENLAQDVWLRVIENGVELIEETALSFLYKVAINLVNDYLRRCYSRPTYEYSPDQWDDIAEMETPQETLQAMQIAEMERTRVAMMPPQRRLIYIMSRFEEKPILDIASELSLSFRTVENHLRLGRHDVREYIRAYA